MLLAPSSSSSTTRKINNIDSITCFDKELFTGPIEDYLVCTICTGVVHDPYDLNCGHLFCGSCLDLALTNSRNPIPGCPTCRAEITKDQLKLNKTISRLISTRIMKCPFFKEGCTWKDTIGFDERNLKQHLNECPCGTILCTFCCLPLQRKDLSDHETKECLERMITCEYCKEPIKFRDSKKHYQKDTYCANLMFCPYECTSLSFHFDNNTEKEKEEEEQKETPSKKRKYKQNSSSSSFSNKKKSTLSLFLKKDLEEHKKICPELQINCPFETCFFSCKRKEMDQHIKDFFIKHLSLLQTSVQHNQKLSIQNLQLQLNKKEEQIKELQTKYSYLCTNQLETTGLLFEFRFTGLFAPTFTSKQSSSFTVGEHTFYLHVTKVDSLNNPSFLGVYLAVQKGKLPHLIRFSLFTKNRIDNSAVHFGSFSKEITDYNMGWGAINLATLTELKNSAAYDAETDSVSICCHFPKSKWVDKVATVFWL